MPKIFLYASAVLLLFSAGLSFVNKGKLAAKNVEITDAHSQTTAAQSDATRAKTAQKTAEKNAAEAATKATDLQNSLTASEAKAKDASDKLDAATKSATDLQGQIDALKLAAANAPKTSTGEGIPDAAQKIADLTHQLDELKLVKDGLEGQAKAAQAQAASLQREVAARATNASMTGLRGQVLAVDHNWNFVVLNLGNRNGVNNNTTMIIQRGGSLVGRVRITSVEPSQSVADIVPNSVPAGIEVRPGDTVVFSGL